MGNIDLVQLTEQTKKLTAMVVGIRNVEMALGNGSKAPSESEKNIAKVVRRSIHYSKNLFAGTILTQDHLCILRPGDGISPEKLSEFIGESLTFDVIAMSKLKPEDFK